MAGLLLLQLTTQKKKTAKKPKERQIMRLRHVIYGWVEVYFWVSLPVAAAVGATFLIMLLLQSPVQGIELKVSEGSTGKKINWFWCDRGHFGFGNGSTLSRPEP